MTDCDFHFGRVGGVKKCVAACANGVSDNIMANRIMAALCTVMMEDIFAWCLFLLACMVCTIKANDAAR